jgi:hypothetical protein
MLDQLGIKEVVFQVKNLCRRTHRVTRTERMGGTFTPAQNCEMD